MEDKDSIDSQGFNHSQCKFYNNIHVCLKCSRFYVDGSECDDLKDLFRKK